MKPKGNTSLSNTQKVFFAALIWLILIILLELGWRLYLYQAGRGFFDDPKEFTSPFFTSYQEPLPYKWGERVWYHTGTVNIDKADNEIRIICFGGSTTVNARAGVSYSAILQERLQNAYSSYDVRVLNAGGEGFSTAHTLVNLSLRNLEIQPDIITVYHNINDLSAKNFGNQVTSDYSNKYLTDFYLDFRHRTGLIAGLTKISRLARFIASRIDTLAFPSVDSVAGQTSTNNSHGPSLAYFDSNLRSIIAVAKAHNIRTVLASQAAESNLRRSEGFADYNRTIEQSAIEQKVEFVDVAAHVTDDELFLVDGIHYTRLGVERVADAFYPALKMLVEQTIETRADALKH